MIRILGVLAATAFLLLAGSAVGQGRIELNQASITAAGGFPVTISAPGNYVLTSDLAVPADTDGFVLTTTDVVFDLNGFAIRGPATCTSVGCAPGAGSAIRPGLSVAFGRRVTVRNGAISGFAGDCLRLSSDAQVADLVVRSCAGDGIVVSSGSLVERNRVGDTGQHGILMAGSVHPPLFSGNAVGRSGLAGGSETTVSGGRPGMGNSCDDGGCSTRAMQRRFYLTSQEVQGGEASTACAPGFRVARIWEIHEPSSLEYDLSLGLDIGKSAVAGSDSFGWGYGAGSGGDCGDWTDAFSISGAVLTLLGPVIANQELRTWRVNSASCSGTLRSVWCIEK